MSLSNSIRRQQMFEMVARPQQSGQSKAVFFFRAAYRTGDAVQKELGRHGKKKRTR